MGQDAGGRSLRNAVHLKPITLVVEGPPDAVCATLLRYAANPASFALPERSPRATWTAQRQEGRHTVTYLLEDGPLGYMRLQFAAEADEAGSSVLWITGEYAQKKSLLYGALERRRAEREAIALRDGVLAVLQAPSSTAEAVARPARAVRGAERLSVRAPARLQVGTRTWRAEVLDVSETGLAVVVATLAHQAESDAELLLRMQQGEIEVLLPGTRSRARVLVKRAAPARGGVHVGLQVVDTEGIMPLLRKALAQAKSSG
jgi:hypothetical protein